MGAAAGVAFSGGGGLVVSSASAARRLTSSASHASHCRESPRVPPPAAADMARCGTLGSTTARLNARAGTWRGGIHNHIVFVLVPGARCLH